ncbi:MAG: glucose-1-phosphate thymidylyltransferase [Candidatus Deianiraeaceae bacterium]|jgi:glucose-1-phosphate thymidylyltransferase
MKAVLLAGGMGTRLRPMTQVFNKHLLPIYNKPMIYYPISTLILLGAREILLTTHAKDMPLFQELFGDGSQWGIKIEYAIQEKAGGIAEVLKISKNFLRNTERFVVALGDNIFHIPNIKETLSGVSDTGASVVLCHVRDPRRFGVAEVKDGKVISVVEKPKNPKSNLAITGLYFYDKKALDFVDDLKPSGRGELEITDINAKYLELQELSYVTLSRSALWLDTGTPEAMFEATEFIKVSESRNDIMIGAPEEVAFREGLISSHDLETLALSINNNKESKYRKYLLNIASGEK